MPRVYTFTRTSATEPEDKNYMVSSLTPPTKEEIIGQLEEHFKKHPKDEVTPEDILKIAEEVSREFEELRDKPYGGFAKYNPSKPRLTISMYRDAWTMHDRELYPADYSPIMSTGIKCSKIHFSMTVVSNTKWISLAYISNEGLF